MPRRCTICEHPEREAIDRALVTGERSFRDIAGQWHVSRSALVRHKQEHLSASLVKAREAEEVAQADDLLAQVRSLQAKALTILDRAELAGDLRTALGAIREARGNLELLAKLLGELQEGQTINVLVLPEWWRVRKVLVEALEPFPDARAAAARALKEVGGHGTGI